MEAIRHSGKSVVAVPQLVRAHQPGHEFHLIDASFQESGFPLDARSRIPGFMTMDDMAALDEIQTTNIIRR